MINNNLSCVTNFRIRNYVEETNIYFPSDPIYSSEKWVANCADYVVCDYNRLGSTGVADYLRGTLKPQSSCTRDYATSIEPLVCALNSRDRHGIMPRRGHSLYAKSLLQNLFFRYIYY